MCKAECVWKRDCDSAGAVYFLSVITGKIDVHNLSFYLVLFTLIQTQKMSTSMHDVLKYT